MVTVDNLNRAGMLFEEAADMVAALADAADGLDAESVLHGGTLAERVPERIIEAAATARRCRIEISAAAETCFQRALELELYHQDLVTYDVEFSEYVAEQTRWDRGFLDWIMDRTYTLPHPGYEPIAPMEPIAPAWLEA